MWELKCEDCGWTGDNSALLSGKFCPDCGSFEVYPPGYLDEEEEGAEEDGDEQVLRD